jgi:3-methyladenine DNA glycosylase Mpg
MEITGKLNGADLTDTKSELLIVQDPDYCSDLDVESAKRVGVSSGEDRPWRFFLRGNEFVSRA